MFATDYPAANALLMDDASDDDDRALLETDISNNDIDIAANQSAITSNASYIAANYANINALQTSVGQLQTAAPNSHYHDVPSHTHNVPNHSHDTRPHHHMVSNVQSSGLVEGSGTFGSTHSAGASTVQGTAVATSGPAGSTAVGHSHGVADIPHTHTDQNATNHVHTTTTNQYQVTHNLAVYSSTPQGGTTSTTSGPQ